MENLKHNPFTEMKSKRTQKRPIILYIFAEMKSKRTQRDL